MRSYDVCLCNEPYRTFSTRSKSPIEYKKLKKNMKIKCKINENAVKDSNKKRGNAKQKIKEKSRLN